MRTEAGEKFESLITRLQEMLDRKSTATPLPTGEGDAIDQVLAMPPRVTGTQSLRDHDVVQKFRDEMLTGVIQIDTMHQIFGLINEVMALAIV